jgi:hypothetical protein
MKVETHTLLLDAALFGSPALARRGPHCEGAALPADQSTAANWERVSAPAEAADLPKPAWTVDEPISV